jgi:hypothetical protein
VLAVRGVVLKLPRADPGDLLGEVPPVVAIKPAHPIVEKCRDAPGVDARNEHVVAADDHPVAKQEFGQRIDGADRDGEQLVTGTIDWTNVQHQFDDFAGAAVVPYRVPFECLDHCSHKT